MDVIDNNKVMIKRAFLDREFFNTNVVDYLLKENILFLMPAVKNSKVAEKAEENYNEGTYVFPYHFCDGGSASKTFTIFTVANDEYDESKKTTRSNPRYFIFATNIKIKSTDHDSESIRYNKRYPGIERKDLADLYGKRWWSRQTSEF